MMGPGMDAWVLIMVLAMALILPAMIALWWQGRNRGGLTPKAKRMHRVEDFPEEGTVPDRDDPTRPEDGDALWREDDGAPPVDLQALLSETEKPKRHEDG